MEDLRQYIPSDNRSWIQAMYDLLGEEKLIEYYDRVFIRMYSMKHCDYICILQEVAPENYNLFIKCVCACISELISYEIYDYHLEENATVIYRS